MKNCPSCNQKPISFITWCNGLNAITWTCRHCQQKLKANGVTWLWLAVIVVAMIATVAIATIQYDVSIRNEKILLMALIVPPAFIGSVICFWLGGYNSAKK
jgi:hypothetical protein